MKLRLRIDTSVAKKTFALYKEQILADKRLFVSGWVLAMISHALRYVAIPLVVSFIVQHLITAPTELELPLMLICLLAVLAGITTFSNSIGMTRIFEHTMNTEVRLADNAARNLMSQSYDFFSNHKVGSLAGDVNGFKRSYTVISDTLSMQLGPVIVNFFASIIVIAFLSPILVVPVIIVTALIISLSLRSFNGRAYMRRDRKIQQSKTNGATADVLGNSILVKIFANEDTEAKHLDAENRKISTLFMRENRIIRRDTEYRFIALFVFQVITLIIGVLLYGNAMVSIATLIFIVSYFGRVTDSLFAIAPAMRQIEQSFLDAAPIVEIMVEDIEVQDVSRNRIDIASGAIDFENVYFTYGSQSNSEETVFRNLQLSIGAGERIGLAGHSGGGKTTLTKLLLRFADVNSGRILIDNQNISDFTQHSLRSQIAYVPQDPYLFHRSLRENIAYGKPGADDEAIISAAKKAYAWEFIEKLPNGLDTIVGERGVKLSGGQRQRIAIARAILKDAPILILDEATSALDSESEKLIQKALESLMKDRTSIVIAHRLSTIAKLDRIIVLDDGKVVEDGTHTELLKRSGTYARLWKHQSGGFIED